MKRKIYVCQYSIKGCVGMQAQMNHSTLVNQLELLHDRLSSLESNFSLGSRREGNPPRNYRVEHPGNPNSSMIHYLHGSHNANPVPAQRSVRSVERAESAHSAGSMWRTEPRSAQGVHNANVPLNPGVVRLAGQIVRIMHSWGENMDSWGEPMDASELVHLPTPNQFMNLKLFIVQNKSNYRKADLKNAIGRQHMNAFFRFMVGKVYRAVDEAYR